MNTCIYTKKDFDKAYGEHILQNFLGARWTSRKIAANEVQDGFGKTIDVSLENGLKSIRNLLGTKGGRGGIGPSLKRMESASGDKYHSEPGAKLNLAEPIVKTTSRPNGGDNVNVKLGSIEQLGWAVAKLKQEFPEVEFDINEIKKNLRTEDIYLDEKLNYSIRIGGNEYFRGVLKSIFNLLGAMNHTFALSSGFDGLRKFILSGDGDSTTYVRWLNNDEKLIVPRIYDFDHFIAVFSKNGAIEGVAQFYGDIPHLVRISERYFGDDFSYSYLVDPFRKTATSEKRNSESFDKELIPNFDDNSVQQNEDVRRSYSKRFSRILKKYFDKVLNDRIGEIVDEILAPHNGELLAQELINKVISEIIKNTSQ